WRFDNIGRTIAVPTDIFRRALGAACRQKIRLPFDRATAGANKGRRIEEWAVWSVRCARCARQVPITNAVRQHRAGTGSAAGRIDSRVEGSQVLPSFELGYTEDSPPA